MSDEIDQEIADCQRRIENLLPNLSAPEMVSNSHRSESWLTANRSAFLHLAVMALRASRDEAVSFGAVTWFRDKRLQLTHFEMDEAPFAADDLRSRFAHSYTPVWLYLIGLLLFVFVCTGAFTVVRWTYQLVVSPVR